MMKNLLKTVFALFLTASAMGATITENFDTFSSPSGYSDYTYNGWEILQGFSESATNAYGSTGKAVRLKAVDGAGLISPSKTGGIGDVSFWYRSWNTTAIDFYIYSSPDSVTWTVIDSVKGVNSITYANFNKTVNDASAKFIKLESKGQERLIIDEFSITDASTGCTGYYIDSIATEICAFDSVEFRGSFYKTDGIYKDTVNSTCDTIYILNLTTTIYTMYDVTDSICSVDDSLFFNGEYLKTAGIYYDTTVRSGNCDSITKLNLVVNYCPQPCSELFISEYIEGSSNNKALEFYNPTNATINLSSYKIVVFRTSNDTLQLNGSVASGDVHVMSHPSAALVGITSNSDETGNLFFNGDDRIELLKDGIVIDRFGSVGVTGFFAQDLTFQRKSAIKNGNLTFDAADWNVLPQNTDSLIGQHTSDCICVPTNDTVTVTVCHGGSYMFDGQLRTMTGFYRDSNLNVGGCDSVIVLNLTIGDYLRDTVDATICDGDSYTFDSQTLTMTGYYSDTMQTAGGCDSISVLNLVVTTIDKTVGVSGMTITSNDADANTTYQWVDCNNNYAALSPAETGQSFTATASGNYAVILTNGSCTDTSVCTSLNTTNINEANNEIGASIYPNPTNDIVNVKVSKTDVYTLTVRDVTGKVVMNKTVINQLTQLDFNGYDSGIYFITLNNKTQKTTFKLTVK